jgi:tetratricopeptide (TPR) repeat protein
MVPAMNVVSEGFVRRPSALRRTLAAALVSSAFGCGAPPPAPVEPVSAARSEPPPAADSASDWLRRGEALVKLGETGNREAFDQAREALERCVAEEPGSAPCQFLLGEACEYTDDEACAARAYTTAIVEAPSSPDYYAPLAETYLRYKLYDQAKTVASEGIQRVPHELENAPARLGLYRLLAAVADRRGDEQGRIEALEAGARDVGSDPELDFELGSTYATLDPPRQADAARALRRFRERACGGEPAPRYKEPCEWAAELYAPLADVSVPEELPSAKSTSDVTVLSSPPRLPTVPNFPQKLWKDGDAFTVWGASYALRSRVHRHEVVREGPERFITITGYVTKTNLPDAPKCAVHRPGRADPPDCERAVPTFWIGDSLDAPPEDCIRVLGWASNYAQVFEAIRAFDRRVPSEYIDGFWRVSVPNPLPAAGAKLAVRGTYDSVFALAGAGREIDAEMGFLTYQSQKVLEAAPELATLPGVTRKSAAPPAQPAPRAENARP